MTIVSMKRTNKTKQTMHEEPDELLVKPGQANWMLDARRDAETNEVYDDALEVLEQRAKEIAAHVKVGLTCGDVTDKEHSITRTKDLLEDMQRVCSQIVNTLLLEEDAK